MDVVKRWDKEYNPVTRLRSYLEGRGLWDKEKDEELSRRLEAEIKNSMSRATKELKPNIDEMFKDVYDRLPPRLESQRRELWEHLEKYKEHYPNLDSHER